ncbi:hypothetical protein TSUD_213940 [Trifolium subterraneum]|uniref:Uncharacterized protein n=1 Tax=Trifolium subterraneum TaxID=3900 RepID=A0A2Z6NK71_TRISU|nr:hypothetical protein TSUD_213940 [Trifolium subterraneum]
MEEMDGATILPQQSDFSYYLAKKEILLIQLKQQNKLLEKIEQLKRQKEEQAQEIRGLDAQKEILIAMMYSYKEEMDDEVKKEEVEEDEGAIRPEGFSSYSESKKY